MPWWGWILFVGFAISMIGLIAYGLLRHKEEPCGLEGIKDFAPTRIPFTLVLNTDFPHYDIVSNAMVQAILFWQEALPDLTLFASFGDVARGGVIGWREMDDLMGTPYYEGHKHAFAWAKLELTEDKAIAPNPTVYVATDLIEGVTFLQLWRAIAHELGHILGLAHDPNEPLSVMHNKALSEAPMVTAADFEWLMEIYEKKVV